MKNKNTQFVLRIVKGQIKIIPISQVRNPFEIPITPYSGGIKPLPTRELQRLREKINKRTRR